MNRNDEFMNLLDFDSYVKAQEEIEKLYEDKEKWAKMCIYNIAGSGFFSSDRTIEQYNKDIWKMKKITSFKTFKEFDD